jgi:mono/diheme cytochrome c family protein
MKKITLGVIFLIVVGLVGFVTLTSPTVWRMSHPARDVPDARLPDIDNGKVMFLAGDCATCHSSVGQSDNTKLGGGRSLDTAFGKFYMPNISPDPHDGIGHWTVTQFIRAMREGVSPGGQNDYPAFPYTSFQRMTADDVRDLFAYIETLPPVSGKAPDHDLKFPFTMRRGVGVWRLAFLDGKALTPDPQKSMLWNRGRYLVEGPAHCAECHSARNDMGAIASGKRFAGGMDPSGQSYIPNITPDETGIGYWSENEIANYLKTGINPVNIKAGGDMAAIVANTSELSNNDLHAIAQYLHSLPPIDSPAPGMPEPNRTAVIRMIPKLNNQAAQSKLTALTTVPEEQIAQAKTLYAVATKTFFLKAGATTAAADGKILGAAPLVVLADRGNLIQVRIDGWQQEGSDSAFYALQGQRILEAVLTPAAQAKVVHHSTVVDTNTKASWVEGSLTVWVEKGGMNPDLAALWLYGSSLYNSSCATCHALQPTGNYLANQWIGNLNAMKPYTSLDSDEYRLLLAYLQYHAQDVGSPNKAITP